MAVASTALAVRRFDSQVRDITDRMRDIVDQAHVSACNKVAMSVRAEVTRAVRERYPGFKAAEIRAAMQVTRATYSKPVAVVRVRGRRMPLLAFSARQNRTGVSVRIRERKTVRSAFIATMASGHTGVFRRTGRFGRRGNPKLEKIAELKTLSVPQAVGQELILARLQTFARMRYEVEFARELKFRAGRAAP